jgi:Protein of unknown function (DUF1631)
VKKTGNHIARRTAATSEPSPLTGLRDMIATAFAADIAAVTPMVCDVLRDEIHATAAPQRRDVIRTALVILARQSGDLATGVARELRSRFDATLLPASSSNGNRPSPLQRSLMKETHVDLEIALAQCAARLKEQAGAEVFQVTARIAALLGKPSLEDAGNPIAPPELAHALMQALARIDLTDQQRLIVFKAFDPALLCIVPDLYRHANALLAELGVLPELKAQYGRPVISRPAAQTPRADAALDEGALAAIRDRLLIGPLAHRPQPVTV